MKTYNVKDFDARGDGVTDDFVAIQNAIDKCTLDGGGTVLFPSNFKFLSSPIKLKSRVALFIEAGSVLKSASSPQNLSATPFISAENESDISILGAGVIDGSGKNYVIENLPHIYRCAPGRQHTIKFTSCSNIKLENFILKDSPCYSCHIFKCRDADISNLVIVNDLKMPNSDGIDPDCSKNIRISNCKIISGDDSICLKASDEGDEQACENIIVSNCIMSSTSCAFKLGSESRSPIRNILVSNCIIEKSNRGLGLQLRDGGTFENILFSDCIIDTKLNHDDWWGKAEPIYITAIPRNKDTKVGFIRNVQFSNIICSSANGVFIQGTAQQNISDIYFDRIILDLKRNGETIYDIRPCDEPHFIKAKLSAFRIENTKNVSLRNSQIKFPHGENGSKFEFLNSENSKTIEI